MEHHIHPSLKTINKIQTNLVWAGWASLIAAVFFYSATLIANAIILILCCLYTYLVIFGARYDLQNEKLSVKDFFTLEGVLNMLQNTRKAFTAWSHILVFDLFAAWVIVVDAHSRDISAILIIPVLLLTMMFGPMGLLVYVALRMILTGSYSDIGFWS